VGRSSCTAADAHVGLRFSCDARTKASAPPPPSRKDIAAVSKRTKSSFTKTATVEPAANSVAWSERLRPWLESKSLLLAAAAVLIATLRIAATYPVFNHTIDEPTHLGCGMEWLARGTYLLEPEQPPLARIFSALGPFLAGERSEGRTDSYKEGAAILYHNWKYERNLTLARIGTLPFLWLACAVLYVAGVRWYGQAQAAVAVILFTLSPPILAHASLATTDMALTATFGLALFTVVLWAEHPAPGRAMGALVGFCCALAFLSKFSSLAFLAAFAGLMLIWMLVSERGLAPLGRLVTVRRAWSVLVAVLVAAVTIWAGYRFHVKGGVPAPELFTGLRDLFGHQAHGHPSYLLGARSLSGFWLFYPVALAVKTPLGLLGLLAGGIALAWRGRKKLAWSMPLACIAGILAVGLYSDINIGTRHVLPIYFFFALLASVFAWDWLGKTSQHRWMGWTVVVLMGWLLLSGAFNHPDYLAYFNELAGDEPERILADSDLDWGQDMLRLSARLRELGAQTVTFSPFINAYLHDYHGFPPIQDSDPTSPSPGWNAVSITVWKVARMGLYEQHKDVQLWPDLVKPKERVGRGVLLYYFPPAENAPQAQAPQAQGR
jgi:hypothetical protein